MQEKKVLDFKAGAKKSDEDTRWDAFVKRCADGMCKKADMGAPGLPAERAAHYAGAARALCRDIGGWAKEGRVDVLIRESTLMALGAVASSMMDAAMQVEDGGGEPCAPGGDFAGSLERLAERADLAVSLFSCVCKAHDGRGLHGAAMAAWKEAGALDFAVCDLCRRGIMKTDGSIAEYVGGGRPADALTWPGMTVAEVLGDRGISLEEIAAQTGYPEAYIRAVIDGGCRISHGFAGALERALGIEASFWDNLQELNDGEVPGN